MRERQRAEGGGRQRAARSARRSCCVTAKCHVHCLLRRCSACCALPNAAFKNSQRRTPAVYAAYSAHSAKLRGKQSLLRRDNDAIKVEPQWKPSNRDPRRIKRHREARRADEEQAEVQRVAASGVRPRVRLQPSHGDEDRDVRAPVDRSYERCAMAPLQEAQSTYSCDVRSKQSRW